MQDKTRVLPTVSAVLPDGTIVEMIYRPEEQRTEFAVSDSGTLRYETSLEVQGHRLVPYSPQNNLLEHGVVLLPSEAEPYDSEEVLVRDIQTFIHRYVDVSPLFERLASYYVLLSWVYESFNELPYLRLRGDPGSGKTRFLLTVGSVCYKPIFASGASTVSPLFRILDSVRGTLIIDEGDFRFSDERAEIVKILNNGNARGFPVLRSETNSRREFNPRAYAVFGPKLVATRALFQDRALETRCLTEEMDQGRLRRDIPVTLPANFQEEARHLRNQLLSFRFRNLHRRAACEERADRGIEPRLTQVFLPLLSIIDDEPMRQELHELARRYDRELLTDRGLDTEAQVLEVIRDLLVRGSRLTIRGITDWFTDRFGADYEQKITPKWIGGLVRKRLHLRTYKTNGTFLVAPTEAAKIKHLFERYGIEYGVDEGAASAPEPQAGVSVPEPR